MSPDEAPAGTVCIVGHPANGVTARKDWAGVWRYTHGLHAEVDYDTRHKAMTAVYIPGQLP